MMPRFSRVLFIRGPGFLLFCLPAARALILDFFVPTPRPHALHLYYMDNYTTCAYCVNAQYQPIQRRILC